jgi:YggT family protein
MLSLLIVIALHTVIIFVLNELMGVDPAYPFKTALLTSLSLILSLTDFFIRVIIINAILSWVSPDPMNPIVQLLSLLSAPIVDPFRRLIPPLAGMLDLSPIAAIFALMFARSVGAWFLSLI